MRTESVSWMVSCDAIVKPIILPRIFCDLHMDTLEIM
jgi:hypothetical protein